MSRRRRPQSAQSGWGSDSHGQLSPFHRMTLAELEFFDKFADVLSRRPDLLTKRAIYEAVGISEAHGCEMLRKLESEERFNCTLVEYPPFKLTDPGKDVAKWARRVLDEWNRIPTMDYRPPVRLGAGQWMITHAITPLLKSFDYTDTEGNPVGLDFDLREALTSEIAGLVIDERIDYGVGVITDDWNAPGLEYLRIRSTVGYALIAPRQGGHGPFQENMMERGEATSIASLDTVNLILVATDLNDRRLKLPVPKKPYNRYRVENYATVFSLTRAGLGLGLVPNYQIPDDLMAFELKESPQREFGILYRKGGRIESAAQAFFDLLVAELTRQRGPSNDSGWPGQNPPHQDDHRGGSQPSGSRRPR